MNAKIENAKTSGLPMVVAQFDICEGEYSNFYHEKYSNDINFRPSATHQGIVRIPAVDAEGKARRGFNSFCGAVEKSNDIKLPTEDMAFLNALKGAVVGIIFGREEAPSAPSGDFANNVSALFGNAPVSEVDSFSAAEDDIPFK